MDHSAASSQNPSSQEFSCLQRLNQLSPSIQEVTAKRPSDVSGQDSTTSCSSIRDESHQFCSGLQSFLVSHQT